MLKARAGKTIILGLSDENMKRLAAGQPIRFDGGDLRLDGYTFVIFNGPTEMDMEKTLRENFHVPG